VATYKLESLAVTSGSNILYGVETIEATTPAYGYAGRVLGFKDTLTGSPAQTGPANNAKLTTTTTGTLTWTKVTGATTYDYKLNTAAAVALGNVDKIALTLLTAGSTNSWSVRVLTPIKSRYSAVRSFITALDTPGVGAVNTLPALGAQGVAIDTTFTWPIVAGATGYEFVIAEDLGMDDPFQIIDYSANSPVNAHKLREDLKYNTRYYWRVRATSATTVGAWTISQFTTAKVPVEAPPPVIIEENPPPPATEIILEIPPVPAPVQVIPELILWIIVAVGAVLVIAVIVLIVRTRRVV